MKIIIQKVSQASVTVDNKVISQIKTGLMLLVGISIEDTIEDVEKLSKKVCTIRMFDDENEYGWKKSIVDIKGEILSVSQFTLMARTAKGTKPDFHMAAKGDQARGLYNEFLQKLAGYVGKENVQDGEFGAMMSCQLTNEGPVTIILDSKNK